MSASLLVTSERFFEQEGDQLGGATWFVTRERFEAEESTHVQRKPRSSDRRPLCLLARPPRDDEHQRDRHNEQYLGHHSLKRLRTPHGSLAGPAYPALARARLRLTLNSHLRDLEAWARGTLDQPSASYQ